MRMRWNPVDEMNALFNDLDRLFRRSLWESPGTQWGRSPLRSLTPTGAAETPVLAFTPALEIYQKDKDLLIRAELPGINPEDVDISVVGNQLLIRGERKHKQEMKDADCYLCESSYGRFERSFTLPEAIKAEEIKASYENGVLEVRVPAKGLAEAHRVTIEGIQDKKKQLKQPAA